MVVLRQSVKSILYILTEGIIARTEKEEKVEFSFEEGETEQVALQNLLHMLNAVTQLVKSKVR